MREHTPETEEQILRHIQAQRSRQAAFVEPFKIEVLELTTHGKLKISEEMLFINEFEDAFQIPRVSNTFGLVDSHGNVMELKAQNLQELQMAVSRLREAIAWAHQ